jgi:replicative DNA helicase
MIHELSGERITRELAPPKPDQEMDINKFIKSLEKELEKSNGQHEKELGLSRLEQMLRNYDGEDKIISSLEIAERIKSSPPEEKHFTGIKGLDEILNGFRKKQLIVVAAPTKNGKTQWCIDLTMRLKNLNPMWLPFEEPAEELIGKFLERGDTPPLFYTPENIRGNTLLWVEKKIIEAKAKYDSRIVFIDHLHFIVPFSTERQDLKIGETMRELKRLAKLWDVVIVLIAHLKKTRMETAPDLEDLRDSSFIAQEADTVIMLWRKTERINGEVVISNETVVSVQANRRTGKTGNILLSFENGKFTELDRSKEVRPEVKRKEYAQKSWIKN